MAIVLCSKEEADERSLMHYRVGGEKKGRRRWQNKNGSYTPEGYKHYAEMYGWGKRQKSSGEHDAASQKARSSGQDTSSKESETSGTAASAPARSSDANDVRARKAGKLSAKLTAATAGTFAGSAVGMRLASEVASIYHLKAVDFGTQASTMATQTINDVAQKLFAQGQAIQATKGAYLFNSAAEAISILGTAAVAAFGIGAIGMGAVAAYSKARSALQKRKLSKEAEIARIDDEDELKHADEERTMADLLDELNDGQKLAVMLMIESILKDKK